MDAQTLAAALAAAAFVPGKAPLAIALVALAQRLWQKRPAGSPDPRTERSAA